MGSVEVGVLLSTMLKERVSYRRLWRIQAERRPAGDSLSYAAVSRVVAHHLEFTGYSDRSDLDARGLKDRVRDALTGKSCTPATLTLFLLAFRMSADDTWLLESALWDGGPANESLNSRWTSLPKSEHVTVSLHEIHYVGPDRRPRRHRTVQTIRSAVDKLEMFPYRFDTPHARVVVEEGGVAGDVLPAGEDLWGVRIALTKPAARGETVVLAYETVFEYPYAPKAEFLRMFRSAVGPVSLRLRFHPSAVPERVDRVFDAVGLDVPTSSVLEVDSESGATAFFQEVPGMTTIGFRWAW